MKHLFYLLAFVLIFAACSKDDPTPAKKSSIDPNAMISIRADESFKLKAQIKGLTPKQIVEQSAGMIYSSHYGSTASGYFEEPLIGFDRGTPDSYKDYENNIIKMWASDIIIIQEGDTILYLNFLKAFDVYLYSEEGDTIAQISNEVLRTAETLIEAAFEAEDFDEVYRLFNEAYTYKAME